MLRLTPRTTLLRRALLAAGLAGTSACGADARAARDALIVATASDLARVAPELGAAFEAQTGARLTITFGSSGQLAQQILQGAPVDVFLSADAEWVDRLETAGRVQPGSRRAYGVGVLALATASPRAPPASVADLADPAYRRIALANPEHAPYGRAARQVLQRAGVYDGIAPRLVLAETARQALVFAETGAVDVAITALPLLDAERHRWVRIPATLHDPLVQTAAVVSGAARGATAAAFVAFLDAPATRDLLARYGFMPP